MTPSLPPYTIKVKGQGQIVRRSEGEDDIMTKICDIKAVPKMINFFVQSFVVELLVKKKCMRMYVILGHYIVFLSFRIEPQT